MSLYSRKYTCLFIAAVLLGSFSAGAEAQNRPKSAAKAFFYSLLVPGLGQRYVESRGSIKYFAAAEALMVGLSIGHEAYSNWLEEDYRAFAVEHAGISPEGKDKEYLVEISKYNSIYIYNEKTRINRAFDMVIPETPENIWVWDSAENRLKFHFKRVDADNIKNRTIYFYSGIFLNHLVSGIHAAIMSRRYNNRLSLNSGWSMKFIPNAGFSNPGLTLRLTRRF